MASANQDTTPDSNAAVDDKLELARLIVQFLKHEGQHNASFSDSQKEGLEIAVDCITQAYKTGTQEPTTKLLDTFVASKSRGNDGARAGNTPNMTQLVTILQQMAPSLLPMLTPLIQQFAANNPQQQTPQQQTPQSSATQSAATSQNVNADTQQEPPPARKQASAEEKKRAEELKNRGNDLMKDDEYKLAYDAYTEAIRLDDNNAVYYSNRAAASSKLGNHHDALRDCEEAIKIDPTYSKAYGRQGLAYVSLNDHAKARDAYKEALKYDPNNESYRNNLALATARAEQTNPMMDFLNQMTQGNTAAGGVGNILSNMMQDPQMNNIYQMFSNMAGVPNNNPTNNDSQQPPPPPPPGTC